MYWSHDRADRYCWLRINRGWMAVTGIRERHRAASALCPARRAAASARRWQT